MSTRTKVLWVSSVVAAGIVVLILFFGLRQSEEKSIEVGAILPMTGSAASYGKWMHNGISLAVEDINREGGVNGRKLVVIFEDSASDNKVAVNAANKLISVDRIRIIETTLTGVTKSVSPITERTKVILFTSATFPGLTDNCTYVFRNATNMANEVDRMAEACKNELNIRRVALLYINNAVGVWFKDYFAQTFRDAGREVTAVESFDQGATDFRTQLTKIKASNPEALYIQGYKEIGLAMKQARELGMQCQFLGATDFELPDVVEVAGEAANGAIYTKAAFDPRSSAETVKSFVSRYREKFGEEPEIYGATMYDATRIIALAVAKAGEDPDKLREFILSIRDYPGVSGITTFLPNGDVSKPVMLKKIEGGKCVPYKQ